MKSYKNIILLLPVMLIISSCKKDGLQTYDVSSLNVVNAYISNQQLLLNLSNGKISYAMDQSVLGYQSYKEFGQTSGSLPFSIVAASDTSHFLYQNTFNFPAASIHSLYVIGMEPNLSTVLLEDKIPLYQDSTSGVRFINLSPNSQPITVNIQGSTLSRFGTLSYKQISDFKPFTTKGQNLSNGYIFEVRDAQSGSLLTMFTWTPKVFFCNTLVITGLVNDNTGNYPVSVFQVNHY